MKKIMITAALLLSSILLYSQEKGHYVSLGGSIGASGFQYDLTSSTLGNIGNSIDGRVLKGLGFGGKLGYSYFFTPYLGVGSGFSVSRYQTEVEIRDYRILFPNVMDDDIQELYDRKVILDNWEGIQTTTFLEVPLLLQFQYKFGEQFFGIYANAGVKFQYPISSSYEVKKGSIENQGKYHNYGEPVFIDMPNHGFGTNDDFLPAGDGELKFGFSATAGLGFLVAINRTLDLYAGGYLDYGFTDIKKNSDGTAVYLDENGDNQYRSLLSSSNSGKVYPVSLGAEVGVRFKFGGSALESREQVKARKALERDAAAAKEEAKRLREEAKEQREDSQGHREAEADKQTEELANSMKRIEDLLAKAVALKNAEVERVIAENNREAIKINFDASILFDFGKSVLSKDSRESLIGLVQLLQENPGTTIDILGHTDNVSSLEFNQRLSTQRAQAVAGYLSAQGISSDQIRKVLGKNYSMPIADNDTEEGRARNRRVEILLYSDK